MDRTLRARRTQCRVPRARLWSIAMRWHSTSDPRSGGSGHRSLPDRACDGITGLTQEPEEMVRNAPNRCRNREPPVAVRVEDRSPLRMSLLVSDVALVPPVIAFIRRPQGAVRHADQKSEEHTSELQSQSHNSY